MISSLMMHKQETC